MAKNLELFMTGLSWEIKLPTVKDLESRMNTHEAVCAERWKETILRIKRIEVIILSSAGALILLMAGMLWKI